MRATNTVPVISRSPIARSSAMRPGLLPMANAQRDDQQLSFSDALDAYKIYNQFSGSPSSTGLLSSKGGLSAVPGGSGYGTAAGGAAHNAGVAAVPGGLSNASVGSSGLTGGKGSGGMMGGMSSAALPLAVFGIPYMWARREEAKHDKQLAKLRAELGPEEVARRNAVAREQVAEQQRREGEEEARRRKLQESDSE